jgi:serine/threonine protein kinase
VPGDQNLGPYRLEQVLGTGSFATVWLAHDEVLDRRVAVKILADNWSQDTEVRRRFLSEARVLLTAESPRIVRGFHLGETPTGQPYLVMAWADRGTLGDRLEQRRREGRTFDVAEVVSLATEIALALVDVHQAGHLHRDVKPTNVLIRSSSTLRGIAGLAPDETVVLADFGLARGLEMTALTLVAGSPGYVAPEQAAGLTQLDRRADLYPIGRIMLELLTGDPGGHATTMAGAAAERIDVAKQLEDRSVGAPAVPASLVELITRLVAESPDDRPSTADEVVADLNAIRREIGSPAAGPPSRPFAPPTAPPPPIVDGSGRQLTGTQLAAPPPREGRLTSPAKRWLAAGAAALVVAAGVVLALSLGGGGGSNGGGPTTLADAVTIPAVVVATSEPAPSSSAPAEPMTTAPMTTAPIATTEPPATEPPETTEPVLVTTEPPPTTEAAPESTVPVPPSVPEDERLALPGVFLNRPESTANSQVGSWEGTVAELVAALREANPDWTFEGPEVDAGADTADFTLTGPQWTAQVHVERGALSTQRDIAVWAITYE